MRFIDSEIATEPLCMNKENRQAASDVARGSGPAGDAMFSEASAIDFNQSFQTEDWENSA